MERLGVVVPVYNRRTILLETLQHVVAQTRLPDRLVVADDGSSDGTPEAARAWLSERRPGFDWEVLERPHRTAAAARVAGYDAVGPVDYVAFLDSDDHWPADFLEHAESRLAARPDAVAVSADKLYTDLVGSMHGRVDCGPLAEDPLPWLFRYGGGITSCTLLRASAYEATGGWDPEFEAAEDTMLFSLMTLEGPWLHEPGEPVRYHLGNAAQRGEENNLSRKRRLANLQWARVYELLLDKLVARAPGLDTRPLERIVARTWRNAGRDFQRHGRSQAARECYARSLRWQRVQYNAYRYLLSA